MHRATKMLISANEVVKALGGHEAFVKLIGCARTSPYNYIAKNRFPDAHLPKIIAECARRKIRISPEIRGTFNDATIEAIAKYHRLMKRGSSK